MIKKRPIIKSAIENTIPKCPIEEVEHSLYDGSFSRMACDYIHATGLTEIEVDALLEEMKHSSV